MVTNNKIYKNRINKKVKFLLLIKVPLSNLLHLFVILFIFFFGSNLNAGTIEIEWDAPLEGEVTGYKVYYGTSSGNYQWVIDVGTVTSTTLTDLDDCTNYFWAIKAYNSENIESEEFSNEVFGWPRPSIEIIEPNSGKQGEIIDLVIKGANFADAPTIEIDNPSIIILSTTQLSCNEIAVTVQIGPESRGMDAAAMGTFDLTVINQDMVYGTKSDAFTITLNESRIDLDLSGRIDGIDLNRFALLFGLSKDDMDYNPDCDFNGDGWIDGDDLSLLAANFGLIF